MKIDDNGLSFEVLLETGQLDAAIEESQQKVQGLSDGTLASLEAMNAAFQDAAGDISGAFSQIDQVAHEHASVLRGLESDYERLGMAASVAGGRAMDMAYAETAEKVRAAFEQIDQLSNKFALQGLETDHDWLEVDALSAEARGDTGEAQQLRERQNAMLGEIVVRRQLQEEVDKQAEALREVEQSMQAERASAEESEQAHLSLRTRITELREQLEQLGSDGVDQTTESYQSLSEELGRLIDLRGDVAQQGSILSSDERDMEGVLDGLSGLTGGFSAASAAMSLFGIENERLQGIMAKLQALQEVAAGILQVQQVLNKDSAFQLVSMSGLKTWWATVVASATGAEVAEAAALEANSLAGIENAAVTGAQALAEEVAAGASVGNTAALNANTMATNTNTSAEVGNISATGGQAAAATAGTTANIGLAGAFRLVGAAIKAIPVWGWAVAGITALLGAIAWFTRESDEARKSAEEFSKAMVDGCYKPIANVERLSQRWKALGDDMEAKQRFVTENKRAFEELGVAVRSVADAEKVLESGKVAFIKAQIEKAKAMIYTQRSMDKVKEIMVLEEEADNREKNPTNIDKLVGTNAFYHRDGRDVLLNSRAVKAAEEKRAEAAVKKEELKRDYELISKSEVASVNHMKEAGIKSINEYSAGTVGALEKAIRERQEKLKELSNPEAYKNEQKEIKKLQVQLAAITGAKDGSGKTSGKSGKDLFTEQLEGQKKEYQRFLSWVSSGDAGLVEAASTEFEGLLKQGGTYLEYLKRQREELEAIDEGSRSKDDTMRLGVLRNKIAEESKATVLDSFGRGLNEELAKADSVAKKLELIERLRKQLKGDGTELDIKKTELLDKAQLDSEKEQEAEQKREKEAKQKLYEDLLKTFGSFEQKRLALVEDFNTKRQAAQEKGDDAMVKQIGEAENKALSKLALEELGKSGVLDKLNKVSSLTKQELNKIFDEIEAKQIEIGVKLDPEAMAELKTKANKLFATLESEMEKSNPLLKIFNGSRDYLAAKNETDPKANTEADKKAAQKKIAEGVTGSASEINKLFDQTIGALDKMGVSMDKETREILNDVKGLVSGASNLAAGIITGNPLQIIQGSIDVISNGYDLIFGGKNRQAERAIRQHAEAIGALQRAYEGLKWAIDKALGSEVYKHQEAAVTNMKAQQEQLQGMMNEERSKKKTDQGKINEWQAQYEGLGRSIEDMLDSISKDILQTDAKSFAKELGDALVAAFGKGEDAAKAFDGVVNNVVRNAVLNQLKKNFLDKQLDVALKGLEKSMGYEEGKPFVFDELTEKEIAAFKAQVEGISAGFNKAMGEYSKVFKDIEVPEVEADNSLTGAVKGVSEETASLLAGQINAVRLNQMDATILMRQQLLHLANIERNTFAIDGNTKYIKDIYDRMGGGDSLRAEGLSTDPSISRRRR